MIIKIQEETPKNDSWWIYDNVHRVKINESASLDMTKLKDVDLVVLKDETTNESKKRLITYLDKNREERSILFNTIMYICNDDGKTIEKVTC